jgi:NarL family two-component system response regulator LiaR
MDGITATKQLIEQFPQAKILMVTDYNDEKLRHASRIAGATAYITKEHLIDIGLFIGNSNL